MAVMYPSVLVIVSCDFHQINFVQYAYRIFRAVLKLVINKYCNSVRFVWSVLWTSGWTNVKTLAKYNILKLIDAQSIQRLLRKGS